MRKIFLTICFLLVSIYAFAVVNINTATVKELMTLKGVGQKRAEAIIKYRKEHGKFKNIYELAKVKGISKKMIDSWGKEVTAN
jgi:competence protein ComEA